MDTPTPWRWDAAMSRRTSPWPPGMPCWADLTVPDVAVAKDFYAAVLGWAFQDSGEEYGGYAMAQVGGAAVAGIGPQQQPGTSPAWTLYIASDDVDRAAAAISEHGGTLLLPPGNVGPSGRLCVAADPSGAPSASGSTAHTSARSSSTSPAGSRGRTYVRPIPRR